MARISGAAAADYAGWQVAAAEWDASPEADFVVSAPQVDENVPLVGAVAVFTGPTTGSLTLDAASTYIRGDAEGDRAGYGLAVGDLDGDGADDLAIGAIGPSGATSHTGAVSVFRGPGPLGDLHTADHDTQISGEMAADRLGYSVAVAGDVDADGTADLLVGAREHDADGAADCGAAYLFAGGPLFGGTAAAYGTDAATAVWYGADAYDYLGSVVGAAGDTNGDGAADVLLSSPGSDDGASNGGSAWLLLGPQVGTTTLSSAQVAFQGTTSEDNVADALRGVGDTNGDGFDDFMIGGVKMDSGALTSAGGAFLLLGRGW
jgi:hypothetical protein